MNANVAGITTVSVLSRRSPFGTTGTFDHAAGRLRGSLRFFVGRGGSCGRTAVPGSPPEKPGVGVALGLAFVALFVFGGRWALMPLLVPPQGLYSGSGVDLVRDRYPGRLVDPAKLNVLDGDITLEWVFAETKARALVLFIGIAGCLLGSIGLIVAVERRTSAREDPEKSVA